ncbi:MAG: hypothetical protein HUJ63_08845 [Enterococcus sp.]|nr:hypothetical protein [Enterococcus sp.]
MSPLEMIIYIADSIEKNRDYEGVDKIREVAFNESLEKAMRLLLERTIDKLKREGKKEDQIGPDTLSALEYYSKY